MLKFSEIVNKVTVGVCLGVVVLCLVYWIGGGFSTTEGYTIEKSENYSLGTVYIVTEVRNSGTDRNIYQSTNIDDALRVLKEIQTTVK